MKKSEAFDSSLKKTFDECCEGEELKKEWSDEFDEKYYNKNNPSGLNTTGFKFQKQMIDDVKSFISSLLAKQQEGFKSSIIKHIEDRKSAGYEDNTIVDELANPFVLEDLLADIKSND